MGDNWECPDCGFSNFATREVCMKCNPRPVRERQEGDWDCPDCGAVIFASKETCFRCAARERDGEKGVVKGGKGKGKGKGGKAATGAGPATLAATVKMMQKFNATMKEVWNSYCDLYGEGWRDPTKHEDAFLEGFLAYVAGLAQADIKKEAGETETAAPVKAAATGKKRPAAQEAPTAPAEKKKVTIKKAVATKIQQLNKGGTLLAEIRLGAVAVSLSQLGEEEQMDCLTLLEEQADDIEDPNDYLKSQAQVMMTATANGCTEEA